MLESESEDIAAVGLSLDGCVCLSSDSTVVTSLSVTVVLSLGWAVLATVRPQWLRTAWEVLRGLRRLRRAPNDNRVPPIVASLDAGGYPGGPEQQGPSHASPTAPTDVEAGLGSSGGDRHSTPISFGRASGRKPVPLRRSESPSFDKEWKELEDMKASRFLGGARRKQPIRRAEEVASAATMTTSINSETSSLTTPRLYRDPSEEEVVFGYDVVVRMAFDNLND